MIEWWRVNEMLWEYAQPGVFRWAEVPGGLIAVGARDWLEDDDVRYYTPTTGWRLAGFRTGDVRHDSSRALRRVIRERLGLKTRARGRLVIITIR